MAELVLVVKDLLAVEVGEKAAQSAAVPVIGHPAAMVALAGKVVKRGIRNCVIVIKQDIKLPH